MDRPGKQTCAVFSDATKSCDSERQTADAIARSIGGPPAVGLSISQAVRSLGKMVMTGSAVELASPLVPSFGILGFLLMVNVVLFIGALISIARTRNNTTGGQVVWALIVLALPVIGSLAWFLVGRRAKNTVTLRQ